MAACQSLSSSGHVKAGTEVGSGAERSWRAPPSRGDRGGRLTGTRSCRKLEYPFSASRSAWIFFDSLLLEARLETRKTEAGSVERESECARGDWHRIGARKGDAFSQRRIAPRARLPSLSLHSLLMNASPLSRPGSAVSPSLFEQITLSMAMLRTFFPSILALVCVQCALVIRKPDPLLSRANEVFLGEALELVGDHAPAGCVGVRCGRRETRARG